MGLGATGYIFLKLGLSITDEDVKNSSALACPLCSPTACMRPGLSGNGISRPILMCAPLLQSSLIPTSTRREHWLGGTGVGEHQMWDSMAGGGSVVAAVWRLPERHAHP